MLSREQRVLSTIFDHVPYGIGRAIDSKIVEHGTTFCTEDQLFVCGDEADQMAEHWFTAAGVPFPFCGNALLVGINPSDSQTADHAIYDVYR